MNNGQRLFDCLDSQLLQGGTTRALVAKHDGQWHAFSTSEVKSIVDRLSAGLLAMGIGCGDMTVEGRDKVALLSKNRPEWIFIDLAVQQIGAVLVPIYPTAHSNDISFIFRDANVKMVFVNDLELLQKVEAVQQMNNSNQPVYTIEKFTDVPHWEELLDKGNEQHFRQAKENAARIRSEDLFTIIYTSGTTGTPKGVMLSHRNVYSNVMSTLPGFPIRKNTRVLSFLPLNHIFERMVTYLYLFAGASIHYAENLDSLGDNIRQVKPEMFTTVPRLLEKVYERIITKGSEQKGVVKKLFFWAVRLGEQYDVNVKGSFSYRAQLYLANKIIFSKWRKGLGNSLKCIITGAAACQVKLIRIFTAAGIPILEGYGQTESSPVISVNRLDEGTCFFGTVGPIIDGVQVKIAEDGEILCKGPNVMMGYYKRPDLTADTVKDGWLYTGDIGTLIENKYLKITDRKKEIFKTSGGKYVAPQPIENKLVESPLIEQVMVVGADQKFTAAMIVPAFKVLREKYRETIDNKSVEEIVTMPEITALIHSEVEKMNVNFNQVEQIKKIVLLPKEWTVESGELTPTLKLKRKVIMERYHQAFNYLYNGTH
ncbi:MAG: AMP-dependent synthetase/ligase [Candidatus Dadabacteria bacterium]